MLMRCPCRLLVVGCDRSQRSGPKYRVTLRGKVAHGYWIRNQRPWHFQISYYGRKGEHGLQLESSGQNLPPPFCAPQFVTLMIFLFGHSTQNYTVYNWFCIQCLISGGQNRLALWGVEKGCWWFKLWFVSYFDLLLVQCATYFLGYTLYIRQHYKATEVVVGGLFG